MAVIATGTIAICYNKPFHIYDPHLLNTNAKRNWSPFNNFVYSKSVSIPSVIDFPMVFKKKKRTKKSVKHNDTRMRYLKLIFTAIRVRNKMCEHNTDSFKWCIHSLPLRSVVHIRTDSLKLISISIVTNAVKGRMRLLFIKFDTNSCSNWSHKLAP